MTQCGSDAMGAESYFRVNAPTALGGQPWSQEKKLTSIRQVADGFSVEVPFTLTEEAFIEARTDHNFHLSHVEMDIVTTIGSRRKTIASAFLEAANAPSSPVNMRTTVAKVLPPGAYIVRIADDHLKTRIGSGACFPLQFSMRIVPTAGVPRVLALYPSPSSPVSYGLDAVVAARFTVQPASFDGVTFGGESLSTRTWQTGPALSYNTNAKSTLSTSSFWEEDGKLALFLTKSSKVAGQASFDFSRLRDAQGRSFAMSPLLDATYSVVSTPVDPSRTPWSGGPGRPAAAAGSFPAAAPGAAGSVVGQPSYGGRTASA